MADFFPLYLLLAGSLSGQEIFAGLLVSALAALAAAATRRAERLHFQPYLGWLRKCFHLPAKVGTDCAVVAAALVRMLLHRRRIALVLMTAGPLFTHATARAVVVVLTRDPLRQVLAFALYGLLLSILFLFLQAHDVALSELAIGTAALPLILLATLAKLHEKKHE